MIFSRKYLCQLAAISICAGLSACATNAPTNSPPAVKLLSAYDIEASAFNLKGRISYESRPASKGDGAENKCYGVLTVTNKGPDHYKRGFVKLKFQGADRKIFDSDLFYISHAIPVGESKTIEQAMPAGKACPQFIRVIPEWTREQ